MSAIGVDVTIVSTKPLEAEYKSSDPAVSDDGQIEIASGDNAVITFAPAPREQWVFQDPWVTINPLSGAPPGELSVGGTGEQAVQILDSNPHSQADYSYEYTLYTTEGALDPRIINKGGTGARR